MYRNLELITQLDVKLNALENGHAEKLQPMKELHKPARKNYQLRHVDIRGIDEIWKVDLVEMQP